MGLLHRAERALEEFVETRPRPSGEGLADWARQRGRRLAAIDQRLAGLKKARDELTPQAEKDCLEQLDISVRVGHGKLLGALKEPSSKRVFAPAQPQVLRGYSQI